MLSAQTDCHKTKKKKKTPKNISLLSRVTELAFDTGFFKHQKHITRSK